MRNKLLIVTMALILLSTLVAVLPTITEHLGYQLPSLVSMSKFSRLLLIYLCFIYVFIYLVEYVGTLKSTMNRWRFGYTRLSNVEYAVYSRRGFNRALKECTSRYLDIKYTRIIARYDIPVKYPCRVSFKCKEFNDQHKYYYIVDADILYPPTNK